MAPYPKGQIESAKGARELCGKKRASLVTVFFVCLAAARGGGAAAAGGSRDDWKKLRKPFDLEAHLTHSLADAPLSSGERAEIARTLDDETLHDSFTDQQRQEERKAVMGARVGSIGLADDGSEQVLVQGPALLCGATGNCPLRIFIRRSGKLQLALEGGGGVLIVRDTSSHGFRDVVTGWHMSAFEEALAVYRWNGAKYEQVDCYNAKFDLNDDGKAPVITDCEKP